MRILRTISLLALLKIAFVPLCVFAQSNYTESLTVTTYYPAPHGVYGILKLTPRTKAAPPCSEGEITYDNSTVPASRGLYYCNSTNQWSKLNAGAGGSSFWEENTATHNIYNNNTGGRVGIGTNNPAAKLSVHGGTLGSNAGDILRIQEIDSAVSDDQRLETFTRRTAAGSTGTTAELILQRNITGVGPMGFLKWPAGAVDPGLGFGSGSAEYMRINSAGNVGIGTINPSQRLEVLGNIRVSKSTPTAPEGNITATGDVCNDAGKCLSQVPPCPCGNTIVSGTTCPGGTVPFMYHYTSGSGSFITCASHKLSCSAGMYGTATVQPTWGTSTACVDIVVNCNYCGTPFTAHICGGGPVETACKRP